MSDIAHSRIVLRLSLPCPLNRMYQASGLKITKSKRARECRDIVADEVCQQLGGRPEPMIGPIAMTVLVHPSTDKRVRPADVDSYLKGLLDAFTHAGLWEDDKQVKDLTVRLREAIGKGQLDVELYEI